MKRYLLFIAASLALQSCAVGPRYERPDTPPAASFKEANAWKRSEPQDHLARGRWWQIYADPSLNALMEQVNLSNQNIRQAEAQFRAARALVQSARAAYFPTLSANASATRNRGASSRFSNSSSATNGANAVNNTYNLSLDASWEVDVWGRLRRSSEAAQANAAASFADLAAAQLSAQAELAQDYFQLQVTDAQSTLLDDNVIGLEKSLQITQNQYAVGVVGRADVLQAETQLKATQAQALDIKITRAQLEHAIAVLIGQNPANFSMPRQMLTAVVPAIGLGLPSGLLERRPDIAAAERRVAAANAQIGIARAAYFPALSLTGTLGYQSSAFEQWVSAANRLWSVGPALALTVFDAGARRAASRQALANYDASVATYRQTTLAAFQDVEDNIVTLRVLNDEQGVQDAATASARAVEAIALNQYKAGTVSYLQVVVAQSTALTDARNSLSIRGRNLAASVALIKALGGGWEAAKVP